MLVQEQKDKRTYIKVHEILILFDKLCLHLYMRRIIPHTIENITNDRIRYNYWIPKHPILPHISIYSV